MKYPLTLTAAFGPLVDTRVLPKQSWPELNTLDIDISSTAKASDPNVTIAVAINLWQEAVNHGAKLMTGMKSDDATAVTLGSLMKELREWGYNDNTPAMQNIHDTECNMASTSRQMLSKTFTDLGIGTASKRKGGPNECFQIEHYSGPAMIRNKDGTVPDKREQYYTACGTTYRAAGAEYTLGVNAAGGALFALNFVSSLRAARELWRRRADAFELPHLRPASDIAWAAWNRAVSATPGASIDDVKYFVNMMDLNKEINQHIRQILKTLEPRLDGLPGWPGVEFSMESEEGKALLGSPVGRWAGYFLL